MVVATLKESGLRGMGGAGFPTGQKWELVRTAEPGGVKYVVCNADESEPGTFKDRVILATQPHLVLEGLLMGMVVVGAEEGWVFIRHEYGPEEQVLRAELEALREAGVVGPNACGSGRRLDVDVFVSPGGYILGEETALLECMEGHRGEPRNKPPFPGTYGLHGRPTLMNSVETLADVPIIVQRGAEWWADQGVGESVGWKFFCGLRPCRAARCVLRPYGDDGGRADRTGRRGERRCWPSVRSSLAGRRPTSSAQSGWTCNWISPPRPRPAPCWARERWW